MCCTGAKFVTPNVFAWHDNYFRLIIFKKDFPDSSVGKESTYNAGDPGLIPGLGRSTGEGKGYPLQYFGASLVAQLVKNPPGMRETWVRSLGWENPLEKGKTTHSSILGLPLWLSWLRICLECRRPGFDPWVGKISQRRERILTSAFWPGEFHGLYSPWGHKELDTTERLNQKTHKIFVLNLPIIVLK